MLHSDRKLNDDGCMQHLNSSKFENIKWHGIALFVWRLNDNIPIDAHTQHTQTLIEIDENETFFRLENRICASVCLSFILFFRIHFRSFKQFVDDDMFQHSCPSDKVYWN